MTKEQREKQKFVKDFVKHLFDGDAAIFAGAGFSAGVGFVNWRELLREIAEDIDLDIDIENDLISIAQYHTNKKGRNKINQKILDEFSHQAKPSINHDIIARLPIATIWTTNYDTVFEEAYRTASKRADIKHANLHLSLSLAKKDVTIYKMHGDVHHSTEAIITKYDYEKYHLTHQPFITALSSDLITKTFLFVGFSFTDPNLDRILSRVRMYFDDNYKNHYAIIRKVKKGEKGSETEAEYDYSCQKQELMLDELSRFHITPILVNEYSEITEMLLEIEQLYKQRTTFISGSATEYGKYTNEEALRFIHKLSNELVKSNYTIVNGFGLGVGTAVMNGALEAIYSEPTKYSETQLIMRPFPQYQTGEKKLSDLWSEYRQQMIKFAGVAIFVFGNSDETDNNIAKGVLDEYSLAIEQGLLPIPISATGYAARRIWEQVMEQMPSPLERFQHKDIAKLHELYTSLDNTDIPLDEHIKTVKEILRTFNS
ncbi:hypothetical protein F0P96_18575 [Hymenobacter busanensis]|uniref:NAD(+) hydrolase ThsA n=1 Tax=Hymenobacter busanensis TaxID=2607656 RepID=A0A7L4ZT07_9BACT|nr:SIR2 family protein [Hymenobacter busanensis]KAA9327239.1 hypothetical protein F0P96_18575 [Hymenobacter busanensis]QHJ05906.1 hypothetical protein GUY19_00785 [Hymenobacter busanensis]